MCVSSAVCVLSRLSLERFSNFSANFVDNFLLVARFARGETLKNGIVLEISKICPKLYISPVPKLFDCSTDNLLFIYILFASKVRMKEMSTPTGLPALNGDVLSAINDMIGRVIIINTTDKKRYSGVLGAVSQDFDFGMQCVVEITKENENNLLRTESECRDKMVFHYSDIVDFAYVTQEIKKQHAVSKFVTDRQYHGDTPIEGEELQEWNGGEEDGLGGSIEDDVVVAGGQTAARRSNNHNNGTGWSVNDMFAANEKMNVVSTFKEDLTQYTTVEVVGTDEDRARAERLAREIESNSSSKFMANLENDDDERDLDKITRQEDFENGNGRKRNNNSFNQQQQQRRNPNIAPNGQPVNRRAEGLRGDRRNSGSSSANNSRYGAPAAAQQNYSQNQQQQQGQKGYRRQNEENDWQMAKGKGQNQGHDHSFRQQQKQMLDPRPNNNVKPADDKAQSATTATAAAGGSRVTDLKNWGNEFSIATAPKDQAPAVPAGNSGSAWNRGPPSSLVAKGSSNESTPPPTTNGEEAETKKEEAPSTSVDVAAAPVQNVQNDAEKHQEDDNVSVTSENDSVITSKSSSFKFNINAPEFKPRVAPATPTATTPVQNEYHPQQQPHPAMMAPQQGPPAPGMGMVPPHMGGPQNQGQPPMMMWQQTGQQQQGGGGYPQNHQFPIQHVPMQGVPGQMYGPGAATPVTVAQQPNQQHQVPTSAAGGQNHQLRDGEYREKQPLYMPYGPPQMVPVTSQQFYHSQYQGQMQQAAPYQMKMMPQQAPQGAYQQRYQQPQVYMMPPQGQQQQPRYQGPPPPQQQQQQQPQQQQFSGEQSRPQSHPNSQPTTPGPRGELPKMSGAPQNGNMQAESSSNASHSGSTSSQSGQRSGSPPGAVPPPPPPQQQHQQQQHPPHHAPPHVGAPPPQMMQQQQQHIQQYMQVFYPMIMPQQMPMQQNQHPQQSLMGERSDQGFPTSGYFDYRTMPNYQQQQQQQQQQMHRQNSLPQQFQGNQGVNPSGQQSGPPPPPPPSQQGTPRDQQHSQSPP
eukprot:NP_001255079.1 Ataxin-2 homolog [Caenorhabditis elegans]